MLAVAAGCALHSPARAQGIDCTKARTASEKAICRSPGLMALDHQIAVAYGEALARQPDQAATLRQGVIAWLRQRDAACALPANAIAQCLTAQLTERLAALAAPATPASPGAQAAPPQSTVQTAQSQTAQVQTAISAPLPPNAAEPDGRIEQTSLPAAAESDTLVHVTSPGRFAIAAQGGGGAALQLVDMLAGPSEIAGTAGSQDGRLDVLLDVGTYKLRVFTAPGASGTVALTLAPFRDAGPAAALPRPGQPLTATLEDKRQRGFWLFVPPADGTAANVRIEAAGRALGDLRLWRDGRELVDLAPQPQRIEAVSGHPMSDLRLVGHVESGTYLVVAYGGPSLSWTDNYAAQPFYLRAGASQALAEGWAGGKIGPFGSEIWSLPPARGVARLDLPAPAQAVLLADGAQAGLTQKSRAPTASLSYGPATSVIELRGAAGQDFTLRTIALPGITRLTAPGSYFIEALTSGLGGDEPPPAVLLERTEPQRPGTPARPPAIVASTVPVLGAGGGWRSRFNLHGETRLLFQSESGGEVSAKSSGIDVTTLRDTGTVANLPPGMFALTLTPKPGVQGILDLTVGKTGQAPQAAAPYPADPVIPLGVQTVAPGQALTLLGPSGPGIRLGMVARKLPVALAEGPLSVTLAAGASLTVPVQGAAGGTIGVAEIGAGPVAFGQPDPGTVVLAAADHARTLVLFWRRAPDEALPIPPPSAPDDTATVRAGTPSYFDLARGEERGFSLEVPEGGLYRVETLGRLHTKGRLATPFIARLGEADANGVGQNMLISAMLRAGRYRVDVRAVESTGHVGLAASTAPMLAGATLLAGGSVRASLPSGTGVGFPISVTGEAQTFHLSVDGIGAAWTGRLEDKDGWPITAPGRLDGLEQMLRPGQYRLLVAPDSVARRVVARLDAVTKPAEIAGHGPHDLPFDAVQTATWREPDGRDQARQPDQWRFSLKGQAHVSLRLSAGIAGDLVRAGSTDKALRVSDVTKATLDAGDYVLSLTSLGRNDRLGYTVRLQSEELQPGPARSMRLPAKVPFDIAAARVVSLTSFGSQPVRAVLRRGDGAVIGRFGAREDDWNIAVSQLLPAGRYVLEVTSAAAPETTSPDAAGLPAYAGKGDDTTSDASSDSDDDDDAPARPADTQKQQTAATQTASDPSPGTNGAANSDADSSSDDDAPAPSVSVRLALPQALPDAPAPSVAEVLPGSGVHVLTLDRPEPGTLVLAQSVSAASAVLALERRDGTGWRTVALAEGRRPVVASPADDSAAAWRIETWTVDGGPEPITLAARAVSAPDQAEGAVRLAALDGMPGDVAVGHVRLGAPGLLRLADAPAGLLVGGWPGHALRPQDSDTVLVQGAEAWLVGASAGSVTAGRGGLRSADPVALSLPAGLVTALPADPPGADHVALWKAESGLGQPGFAGGMGVAPGSALALAGRTVSLRRADDSDDLRLRLIRLELALSAPVSPAGPLHVVLQPGAAVPVALPPGDKRLTLDLPPGTAGLAGWRDAGTAIAWAGDVSVTRSLAGGWTEVLLVNTGRVPAPVALSWQAEPAMPPLQAGQVIKRFFGEAGSFEVTVAGSAGARIVAAGTAGLTWVDDAGGVQRGRRVQAEGAGRLVVRHGVGAMAVWMETDAVPAWPAAAAQPSPLPARVSLSGAAMTLSLSPDRPVLLHATSTAPVLIGVQRPGQAGTPALFASGASFHRMLPAGAAELRVFAPQEGGLSGTLDLSAEPPIPITEGVGAPVSVSPGGAVLFSFTLAKPSTIGVGVRADPDRATVRLLTEAGQQLGQGVALLRTLPSGRYVIEASVPANAATASVRPAVVGLTPAGHGPPPDVATTYLALVGMKPQGDAQ